MSEQNDDQRWDQAVQRLVELTESGQLRWKEQRLPKRPLMDAFVGPQFVTEFESRRIAVYEYSYRTENWDYGQYVDSRVVVEFVDKDGEPIWVWPVSSGKKWHLLEMVRFQVSQAGDFLDLLLGTHSEPAIGPATP